MEETLAPNAMAFYNPNGLVPAWKHSMKFIGDTGGVLPHYQILLIQEVDDRLNITVTW